MTVRLYIFDIQKETMRFQNLIHEIASNCVCPNYEELINTTLTEAVLNVTDIADADNFNFIRTIADSPNIDSFIILNFLADPNMYAHFAKKLQTEWRVMALNLYNLFQVNQVFAACDHLNIHSITPHTLTTYTEDIDNDRIHQQSALQFQNPRSQYPWGQL